MRFYVNPESVFPEKNTIDIKDKAEVHHIRDVMRLKKGIDVIVFDGKGKEYSGIIKEIGRTSVTIEIKKSIGSSIARSFRVTLYQAIPKKSKFDFIVEKAVELGVDAVVPIITERTVPDVKESTPKKIDRWVRIAKASSKQCGRRELPIISDVKNFSNALTQAKKSDLVLFAALDKDRESLNAILKRIRPKDVSVFVGPEGDFSPKEVSLAKEQGCRICSLGPLVLRVETAAIYILSSLSYEYTR